MNVWVSLILAYTVIVAVSGLGTWLLLPPEPEEVDRYPWERSRSLAPPSGHWYTGLPELVLVLAVLSPVIPVVFVFVLWERLRHKP